jgi:hypothetical protein
MLWEIPFSNQSRTNPYICLVEMIRNSDLGNFAFWFPVQFPADVLENVPIPLLSTMLNIALSFSLFVLLDERRQSRR